MATNDVLDDLSRHVMVFWERTFPSVPDVPGVYAWYYPLRIRSPVLGDLIDEINTVFSFDSLMRGRAEGEATIELCWRTLGLHVGESPRHVKLPPKLVDTWDSLIGDIESEGCQRFRRSLLASSILLPPLYVGKTSSLQLRCHQHIRGAGDTGFHDRFETFAAAKRLHSTRVESLLFACVRLEQDDEPDTKKDAGTDDVPRLLEAILQIGARPPFGLRL